MKDVEDTPKQGVHEVSTSDNEHTLSGHQPIAGQSASPSSRDDAEHVGMSVEGQIENPVDAGKDSVRTTSTVPTSPPHQTTHLGDTDLLTGRGTDPPTYLAGPPASLAQYTPVMPAFTEYTEVLPTVPGLVTENANVEAGENKDASAYGDVRETASGVAMSDVLAETGRLANHMRWTPYSPWTVCK